jgi:hypothetical protein
VIKKEQLGASNTLLKALLMKDYASCCNYLVNGHKKVDRQQTFSGGLSSD